MKGDEKRIRTSQQGLAYSKGAGGGSEGSPQGTLL